MGETKNDLNRIGLFSEVGYVTVGDPYGKGNSVRNFNDTAYKGRQMLPGGSKSKSSLQAGYFDKTFNRIMQGEGYSDPLKKRRQDRLEKSKQDLSKPFMPSHAGKEPSGLGSHYGTFTGPVAEFSPLEKTKDAYVPPGKNIMTNPSKKGTGYGYVNVTIGKNHKYSSEPYDAGKELMNQAHSNSKEMMKGSSFKLNLHPKEFFDGNPYKSDRPLPPVKEPKKKAVLTKPFKYSSPAKEIGGSKSGCFTQYPSHSEDIYNPIKKTFRENNKEKNIFKPPQIPKSRPVKSVMTQNIDRKINRNNFREASLSTVSVT